jgi:hypothetical protein
MHCFSLDIISLLPQNLRNIQVGIYVDKSFYSFFISEFGGVHQVDVNVTWGKFVAFKTFNEYACNATK